MGNKILWTDKTWNPIVGCSKISPGCKNCYAERMAKRLKAMGRPEYQEVVDENGWTGKTVFVKERLKIPYGWEKPQKIFVGSMTDLFHESVKTQWIDRIFETMVNKAPQHTYQILTKRPEQMLEYLRRPRLYGYGLGSRVYAKNIWIGVTVENQEQADKRIPILLQIPSAVRFVSIEPMLGEIDLRAYIHGGLFADPREIGRFYSPLDWVICGGESGPGARPIQIHPEWVRGLRDQCQGAGVPFFFKQWGKWGFAERGEKYHDWRDDIGFRKIGKQKAGRILDGRTWDEFPTAEDVRNRRKK